RLLLTTRMIFTPFVKFILRVGKTYPPPVGRPSSPVSGVVGISFPLSSSFISSTSFQPSRISFLNRNISLVSASMLLHIIFAALTSAGSMSVLLLLLYVKIYRDRSIRRMLDARDSVPHILRNPFQYQRMGFR